MKKVYMEPQLATRAYLQNVAIGNTEEEGLGMMSLGEGDNEVQLNWD